MTGLRFALAALAALSLSACVSVKEPIGTSVGYVNDPALDGLWLGAPDGNSDKRIAFYHVIPNDDHTMTVVGVAPKTDKEKASWGTLKMTTVVLGANHYMNVRETSEDGKPPKDADAAQSIPLYYTISGDTLSLFAFDEKKVKQAILNHRIDGTITKTPMAGGSIESMAITADGPHLDAVLRKQDAPDLFSPVMTLHRR
jgi:hypothetical protein